MTGYEELAGRWEQVVMPCYATPAVALARGAGCTVWDVDGRAYLDLIAGIAVSSLGHAHPALVAAVSQQVARLAHTSNLVINEPAVLLAERLVHLVGGDARVFLCNSGTEANEAMLKLVRRVAGPGRPRFVAAEHSFHGRSAGALALTGKESIRAPFAPFAHDVTFVRYGDLTALEETVDEGTAAVVLEPTLGEAGVVPPPPGYLAAVRKLCDQRGALFVLDEVQSGIGRTGSWFAHQRAGVLPDIMTLAKGLGGGLPIGACVGLGHLGAGFRRGDHGSTFGGNPVTAAAALAVLDTIERDGLLAQVAAVGDGLARGLAAVRHPLLDGVRGVGLWLALVLREPVAAAVETAARDAGFLVNAAAPTAVRLAPPLVLTEDEAQRFVAALPSVLDAAQATVTVGTSNGSESSGGVTQ
ncbi:MAG TPA: acetylornithine transaminase [Mycobacteriales bacterium]|nr:acetylornithine transaminase [Mycobacteriales bacterium]